MVKDKELSELREYIIDLKAIKSEVFQVLEENNEKDLSRASKHYPGKLNHLLTKRNIKSARSIFPFLELLFFQKRKQDIDLIDLNYKKDDIDLLWDVIRRIDGELDDLDRGGLNPAYNTESL